MKIAVMVLTLVLQANAAVHVVRSGGTGDGSDWSHALPDLPSNLVRGDTYYIAAGTYGAHTFNDAGTARISIFSATPGAHGVAAGWVDAMAGEAVFSATTPTPSGAVWEFLQSHYFVDGMVRNTDWRGGEWIHVSNTNSVAPRAVVRIGDHMTNNFVGDVWLQHVNIEGAHPQVDADNHAVTLEYRCGSSGTVTQSSIHDSGGALIFARGKHDNQTDNFSRCNSTATALIVIDQTWLSKNYSSAAQHSEVCACSEGVALTFSNNRIEDPMGTAVWATPSGGGASTNNIDNGPWLIFGNYVAMTQTRFANGVKCGIGGMVQIFDTRFNAPFRFFNNVINNVNTMFCDSNTTPAIQLGLGFTAAMQEVTVQNNSWTNSTVFNAPTSCPPSPVSCSSFVWADNVNE